MNSAGTSSFKFVSKKRLGDDGSESHTHTMDSELKLIADSAERVMQGQVNQVQIEADLSNVISS